MPVLFDITLCTVIFPLDGCYVAYPHYMVLRIRIYNKVAHLLFGIDGTTHVDRHVLLLIR